MPSTGQVTDVELVARARGGDKDAFGELVERHRISVYRAALAALRSPAEAEDAAQEAFVTAYLRLDSFRGESTFKTWLLSIAWREALDRRRSLVRRLRRFSFGEPLDDGPDDPGPSPECALLNAERLSAVRRLVKTLPAPLRDALLLQATGDHTYEALAEILGTPSGTIKWRVSEARRILRSKLETLGYA